MTKKAILFSIKPQYVSLIESGQKKYELRRQKPNISSGDLAFVYESSPTKSLVGAFNIGHIITEPPVYLWETVGSSSGLSKSDFLAYFDNCQIGCALEIIDYWRLAERVCISKMRERAQIDPPQSYRFLTNAQIGKMMDGSVLQD